VLRDRVHFQVRVMAGDTVDAGVSFVETFASSQAIGLESKRGDVMNTGKRNFLPGAVTLATKV